MATPPRIYDVIIVGMGPAGATAAYELRQRGLSVLGLDKQVHPRYKVCGGGLSARIASILPTDFPSIVEETIYRVQFTYGGADSFFIEFPEPIAFMVTRPRFDHWLLDKAKQAGAEVHEDEAAVKLEDAAESVSVTTARNHYQSRVVIGADGAMSVVAHQLFPERRLRKIPALESEIVNGSLPHHPHPKTALISLSAAKKGYGWIFPKHHALSCGVGEFMQGANQPKQSFLEFTKKEPAFSGMIVPAPLGHPLPIFNHFANGNGHRWNGGLVHKRAILIGDAGHLVDPLLGEGIYYAVRSGQLAARSIHAALQRPSWTLEDYESAVIAAFGQEFLVASRLSRIIYGLPRSWHHWVGKTFPSSYQRLLQRYCQFLQGHETYQTLWAKILQRLKIPVGSRLGY